MGDFNGTCGLTRTAIREGDEVFYFETDLKLKSGNFETVNGYAIRNSMSHEIMDLLPASDPRKKSVFWTDAVWPSEVDLNLDIPYIRGRVGFGKYDGYGWVDEKERDDRFFLHFLVHKNVAIEAAKKMGCKTEDPRDVLFGLLLFAFLARRELIHIQEIVGTQYEDMDEIVIQMEVQELTSKILSKHAREITEKSREC